MHNTLIILHSAKFFKGFTVFLPKVDRNTFFVYNVQYFRHHGEVKNMRQKTTTPEKIIEAAIRVGAAEGIGNLSTRKVAAECGISDGYLFNYFANKSDLLTQSFFYIHSKLNGAMSEPKIFSMPLREGVRSLWIACFDFLVSNPEYARYLRSFRYSSFYTKKMHEVQKQKIPYLNEYIEKSGCSALKNNIMWIFMFESAVNFAVEVSENHIGGSEKDREFYFSFITDGVGRFLVKDE